MVLRLLSLSVVLFLPAVGVAKIGTSVREQVVARFPPAATHRGLMTAQSPLEPEKLRGFVVIEKGGIPAEKAFWFVTNQDYEYRPVVIEDETIATRRGTTYTYLQPGQVMAITALEFSGNAVYLKLLSIAPVAREGAREKHPSRVATMLGFKFPKAVAASDADAVLNTIASWCKPFPDRAGAEAYAAQVNASTANP